jgi:hypothetical protein
MDRTPGAETPNDDEEVPYFRDWRNVRGDDP